MSDELKRRLKSFFYLLLAQAGLAVVGVFVAYFGGPSFQDFLKSVGVGSVMAGVITNVIYQALAYVQNHYPTPPAGKVAGATATGKTLI